MMNEAQIMAALAASNSTYCHYWQQQIAKATNPQRRAVCLSKIQDHLTSLAERKQAVGQLTIKYPAELPVSQAIATLRSTIAQAQVTIVCGETGSGKTTQLPKLLLEMGYASAGIIGHTQPRRLAAKSLAARIGQELGLATARDTHLVGVKMRFHDRTSPLTAIKLMTDGILLQEIQNDKLLLQYSALIIDEVHERSLNIDFILGYLQNLLIKRPDLKVIITSATMENDKLAKFFNNAPVINVSGQTYPVDIIYQPPVTIDEEIALPQAIYQAISAALEVERGHGLVFLPGEREIKQCLNFLRKTELKNYELLPLFSRQNNQEQSLIFNESGRLKIILATNIAETSLTIPGIKFVIDSGLARVKRYSAKSRVEQLQIEAVSQASSRQRAGRAGRVSHGLCVRLFSEEEFKLRPAFSEPELLRSNLANVILRLLSLNLGDPTAFPFLDQPKAQAYSDGLRTLTQLQAIDDQGRITPLGRKLANIPVDVRLARILVAAADNFACLGEALIIVAFLAIQDPREVPLEQQSLARERHSLWRDKRSEFMTILNLWHWYHQQLEHKKSNKKLAEVCHYHFVSLLRLKEWHELHRQLKETMLGLGYRLAESATAYQPLHSALLSGFLVNIGQKDVVESYYQGCNGRKFYLHPSVSSEPAKWVVAATLVTTSRLYARIVAQIEPQWLNGIADHLYKYSYSNPQWVSSRGEVVAQATALLYGLPISKSSVSYAQIDPQLAQQIMIKDGLIAGNLGGDFAFLRHNTQILNAVAKLEDKLRTSLVMIEDELANFYQSKLPASVVDLVSLQQFLDKEPQALHLDQKQFVERLVANTEHVNLYPDQITVAAISLKVKYVFDHESSEDGMVVLINLSEINLINNDSFDWLVPGLIREKLQFMLKALPKAQRVQLNPLADTISAFLEYAKPSERLVPQLISFAKHYRKLELDPRILANLELPRHLRCHFRIMDKWRIVASGDDLAQLQQQVAPKLTKLLAKTMPQSSTAPVTGFVPQMAQLLHEANLTTASAGGLTAYYSLQLNADNSVSLSLSPDLAQARRESLRGIGHLIKLQLKDISKYLTAKKIPQFKEISLYLRECYSDEQLAAACVNYLIQQSVNLVVSSENLPRSEAEFAQLVAQVRGQISQLQPSFQQALYQLAKLYGQIKLQISKHPLAEAIELELDDLIYPEFLSYSKWQFLQYYPRYLQAIVSRLSRYAKAPVRDQALADEVLAVYDQWYNYVDDLEQKGIKPSTQLYDFKYKIAELRISFFAPELKTLYPVSVKRLETELKQLYHAQLA